MNREDMIKDTQDKLDSLRPAHEEYLLLEGMLKWLNRPSREAGRPKAENPRIVEFIKDVMADGEPRTANDIHRLVAEDPNYSSLGIQSKTISARMSEMARDGYLIKLPRGQGYKIAPDKRRRNEA